MNSVFWGSLALVIYALVGYPLLVCLVGIRAKSARRIVGDSPSSVSIVIAVHDGESQIARKIEHLLGFARDYDFFELIVASDGSEDRTEEIVRSYASRGVKFVANPSQIGKNAALDSAVKLAEGEILVFSDASGTFSPNALESLVGRFADPSVGCVGGDIRYARDGEGGSTFRLFKRIDVMMKRGEGAFGFVPSVSGAIHAIRTSIYEFADAATTRDVMDPVQAAVQGYRCEYEPRAVVNEMGRSVTPVHFDARVRMTLRGMTSANLALRELIRGRRLLPTWIFLSHKVLRWWLWVPLAVLLVSGFTLASEGLFYGLMAAGIGGLALVGAVHWLSGEKAPRILAWPGFACLQVAAMAVGTLRWLWGEHRATWTTKT